MTFLVYVTVRDSEGFDCGGMEVTAVADTPIQAKRIARAIARLSLRGTLSVGTPNPFPFPG